MRRYEVGTDGTTITTFSYTNAEKNADGYATINFTITGSFVDTPNVRAACEGNWISGTVTCNAPTNNGRTVTGSVKVKPTTAYVGDERKGKLSLYVPYYGATGIGQIDLTAAVSTNIGLSGTDRGMQILEKSAEETEATVTFSLDEGGSAPSSSGPCKLAFDFDYTLTNEITENGVRVETGNGFSNTYKANGWLGAGACTYDASTKTYTQKIDLTYNMDTEKSRTAAVIVYSPSGREVTRFVIEQDKLTPQNPDVPVIDNIPITKLVPSGKDAANCYIITGPGRYELPAYKGAYKANQLTDDKKCEGRPIVVWNDNSGNTIEFFQKDLADNKILIDINPTKTNGKVTGHSGAVSNGNAVVAVKGDDGKILWSWHLWFCATVPGDQDYGSGVFLMDRSLGAKESANLDLSLSGGNRTTLFWKDGLYYQWGRKDPLNPNITSGDYRYKSEMSGNLTASIQNPNSLYTNWNSTDGWDASKKLHDPCPQGYKVPSVDVWTKVKATSTTDVGNITRLNANEFAFVYALADPTIVYPYMGYLAADGSKQTGTIGEGVSEQKQYSLASNTKVNNPSNQSLQFSKPSTNPIQYDKIYYRLFDITVSGVYWANSTTSQNANSLEYGYKDKGIQIISYQKSTGVWKATGSFVKRYSADYSSASVENITIPPDVTDIEGMIGSSDYTALINAIKADIALSGANFSNIFEKIGTAFTKEPIYDKKQNSPAYGYTVRCIKINE